MDTIQISEYNKIKFLLLTLQLFAELKVHLIFAIKSTIATAHKSLKTQNNFLLQNDSLESG